MLQTAAASKVNDERVVGITEFTEDFVRFLDDLGGVSGKLFEVVITLARHDEAVYFALNVEFEFLKITHLER